MTTTETTTVKDITVTKNTVIPYMYPSNTACGFDFFVPAGSLLSAYHNIQYVTISNLNGTKTATPLLANQLYEYLYAQAIEDGAIPVVTHDTMKVFKMFSLITENRIVPETKNFVTNIYAENIEEAQVKAKQYIADCNCDFEYEVRE